MRRYCVAVDLHEITRIPFAVPRANNRPAPYAVLLQDHGFGGNYSNFGADGVMEKIAQATKVLPEWLIVGPHTQAWQGYYQVNGVEPDLGGMHGDKRSLYRLLLCK